MGGDTRFYPVAGAVLVVATPLATWWLVGDLSEDNIPTRSRDYVMRAPDLPSAVVNGVGVLSLALVISSSVVLWHAIRYGQVDRRWRQVLLLVMAVGVLVSAGFRVLTAGVGGANIGGGLVVLFGSPIAIVLLVVAWVRAAAIFRRRPLRG